MTVVSEWIETREQASGDLWVQPDGSLTVEWWLNVPAGRRVRRVIVGGGFVQLDTATPPSIAPVRALTWLFRVRHLVGPTWDGEARPSTTVNDQGGILTPAVAVAGTDPASLIVAQTGAWNTVNAARSDGEIGIDHGLFEYRATFKVQGFYTPGWSVQAGQYSFSKTMRLQVERED